MAKVIVVDDDYSTTNLIRMLLEMEGYAVSTFTDTGSALQEAEKGVSAFIIDCYLGKNTSGIDLLRAIRRHTATDVRDAPVIMVSGDQRLAKKVVDEGADMFLLKPYSPNDLTRQVQDLITARA
ncbi:MAG: response regulator [Chloroflexota bacterium]